MEDFNKIVSLYDKLPSWLIAGWAVAYVVRLLTRPETLRLLQKYRTYRRAELDRMREELTAEDLGEGAREVLRRLYEAEVVCRRIRRPAHSARLAALLEHQRTAAVPINWEDIRLGWHYISVEQGRPEIRIGAADRIWRVYAFLFLIPLAGLPVFLFVRGFSLLAAANYPEAVATLVSAVLFFVLMDSIASDGVAIGAAERLRREWTGRKEASWARRLFERVRSWSAARRSESEQQEGHESPTKADRERSGIPVVMYPGSEERPRTMKVSIARAGAEGTDGDSPVHAPRVGRESSRP